MELSKEYLEINIDPVSKKPKIKASQFVGSVQFDGYGDTEDGFRINVIPKIYQEYTPDVWKKIAEIIGNNSLETQMEECVTLVKRDIVYTESLYI